MTNGSSQPARMLEAALGDHGQRLTRARLLSRLLVVAAAAAPVPLVVVAADHAWPGGLPRTLMVAAALLWVVGLAAGVVGLSALTVWRRWDPVFVARDMERSEGIAHNALVNAVLVRDQAELGYAAEGAARQAAVALRGGVGGGAAPGGVWGKAAGVLLVTAVLWVVYGVLAPKPLLPSLARFVGVALPAPTATRLELLRPAESEVIHAGEALAIEIAVRGRAVADVWFELLGEGEGVFGGSSASIPGARAGAGGSPHDCTRAARSDGRSAFPVSCGRRSAGRRDYGSATAGD